MTDIFGTQIKNEVDLSVLDNVFIPEESKQIDETEDKYIIHSKQIDTHSIKRIRVKITPAVCDICGLDILSLAYSQNKVSTKNYDEISDELKTIMQNAVQNHKRKQHNLSDNLIVSKSQLPKKWLAGTNE